jgi:hypothetical protein
MQNKLKIKTNASDSAFFVHCPQTFAFTLLITDH